MYLAQLFTLLTISTSWTFGNQCSNLDLGSFVDTSEARWNMVTPHFQCLLKCRNIFGPNAAKKPALLERVFNLKRNKVNCLVDSIKRAHHDSLEHTYGHIKLLQFQDLPLFFYKSEFKVQKFEAEKFCARMSLKLGFESLALTEIFLNKHLKSKEQFWIQEMAVSNWNLSQCQAIWISANKSATKEPVYCREQLEFVCTLPWEWHNEVCTSRCLAPNSVNTCKDTQENAIVTKPDCFPLCANLTCVDDDENVYGFKAADGDLYEICDRSVFISKQMNSHKHSQVNCCGKNMQVLALDTPQKKECFRKELEKLKTANGTSFWTSGSSEKCSNSYGWCTYGDKEFINFDLLGLENFQSAGGKECVSAAFENSSLVLRADTCGTKKRYICERASSKQCKEAVCPNLNCSREIIHMNNLNKGGKFKGYDEYRDCKNKSVHVDLPGNLPATYYKAYKYKCTTKTMSISFQTKEKHDCILSSLLANKVAPGKYWVGAVSIGCNSKLRWCDKVSNPVIDLQRDTYLNWKKGEPSSDPLKECTVVDFKTTPPHFTFFKSDCNAAYHSISELDPPPSTLRPS